MGGSLGRGVLGQEVGDEQRDILEPLTQGRQVDLDHIESVEEVFAEPILLDLLLQALVRGGHHANIHLQALMTADPFESLLLEDPEQLGLHRLRNVADLVQEDRPLVGQLEPALAAGIGRGKRSLLVAE